MRSMDAKFRARFRRRLCYGSPADLETPSLPLTEAAVDFFHDTLPGPEGLGRLDLSTASRISGQKSVSPCSMVMSVLYAKRLKHRNSHFLQSMSSSDIFFISMMMASKYLYDEGVEEEVYNDEWAEVTGQEGKEVNQMEVDFLDAMDWGLFVRPEEFEDTLAALERRLALKEGLNRGWFTYTELAVLLDGQLMHSLWNQVGMDCSKLATVLSMAYLASVVSMIGSAAIAVQLSGPLTTATLAVLSVQSSCFLGQSSSVLPAVVSTKPTLHDAEIPFAEFETNLSLNNAFQMPQLTPPTQENVTEEMNPSVSADASVGSLSPLTVPTVNGENQEEGFDSRENNTDNPPVKLARSSVLSFWFFDSLLSQIWSVVEQKPQREESCDKCQQQPSSLQRNARCGAKNGPLWKWCRMCQPCCIPKSGRRNCRSQRTTALEKQSHGQVMKCCRTERLCFHTVDSHGKDRCHDGGSSSISSSPRIHSDEHNSLTCCVSNAKDVSSEPTMDFPLSNDFAPADVSSGERENSAFLNMVLNQHCKLTAFLPSFTFSPCEETTIFSGLPAAVLVT